MITRADFQKFGLRYNPFPPGATGAPAGGARLIPGAWAQELHAQFDECIKTDTPRVMTITGPPGSGKTSLLRWMAENLYQPVGIRTHIITNPTLNLFRLVDQLIEQTGSFELSKGLWELLKPDIEGAQGNLTTWTNSVHDEHRTLRATDEVRDAILKQGISRSPEVADLLGKTLIETRDHPYYRFRSLDPTTPRKAGELTESFKTVIRLLQRMQGASGVALLVDDFTDLTIESRLNRRQVSDYHETLNVLRKTTQSEDFWLVMARNKNTDDLTQEKDRGEARKQFDIPPLTVQNAYDMVYNLIREARTPDNPGGIWPFTKNAVLTMNQPNRERPKALMRTFSRALTKAAEKRDDLPISNWVIWEAQEKIRASPELAAEPVAEQIKKPAKEPDVPNES